jgi:hypothetical protein
MRGLLLAIGLLVGACDDDICLNDYGNAYTCSCSRRCQGVTDTYSTSYACFTTGDPAGAATSSCEASCSPEATCSCSCTQGAECVIDNENCH